MKHHCHYSIVFAILQADSQEKIHWRIKDSIWLSGSPCRALPQGRSDLTAGALSMFRTRCGTALAERCEPRKVAVRSTSPARPPAGWIASLGTAQNGPAAA